MIKAYLKQRYKQIKTLFTDECVQEVAWIVGMILCFMAGIAFVIGTLIEFLITWIVSPMLVIGIVLLAIGIFADYRLWRNEPPESDV